MADEKRRRMIPRPVQIGSVEPGQAQTFTIALKFAASWATGEDEARVAKFVKGVNALLEGDPAFEGIECCESGAETIAALTVGLAAHEAIAETKAARKARDN